MIGLLTIVQPWFFEASRRVRPDIYAVALALGALWCLLHALSTHKLRHALLTGVLIGLAALAHPNGLVLATACVVGVLVWQRPARPLRPFLLAAAGFVVAILPYVVYVIIATRHPDVDFFEQNRGAKSLHPADIAGLIRVEQGRWRQFLQLPKGAPMAVVLLGAWLVAWYRSGRVDKQIATIILLFSLALPFTTVNITCRYLVGLIPFFGALLVRLAERIAGPWAAPRGRWSRVRIASALGVVGIYAATCVAGVGIMLYRLRNADFTRVLDRVVEVTGPNQRVYGEMLLWLGNDRFTYGPYPIEHPWQHETNVASSYEMVRRYRFDYAVRSARTFTSSGGVSPPPPRMPDWRGSNVVDVVCRDNGTKVASFYDPYFGPFEVYKLDWDERRDR